MRKADVRRGISQLIGSNHAKAFDRLYAKLKQHYGGVRFTDKIKSEPIIREDNFVRFVFLDPEQILDNMIWEVAQLKEKAIEHRAKYPSIYAKDPHRNAYLFD